MSQVSWTTGGPLAFKHFDSYMKPGNWKLSWDQYFKFVEWYHIILQQTLNTEKWKDFHRKKNISFTTAKKAALINSLIGVEKKETKKTCVVMLVWYTAYTYWIKTS